MTKYCIRCGAKLLIDDAKYCHECGEAQAPVENGISIEIGENVENSQIANAGRDVNIYKTGDEKYLRQCNVCKGTGTVEEWVMCPNCSSWNGIIEHWILPVPKYDSFGAYIYSIFSEGCKRCGGSGYAFCIDGSKIERDEARLSLSFDEISDQRQAALPKDNLIRGKGQVIAKVLCMQCNGQGVVKI